MGNNKFAAKLGILGAIIGTLVTAAVSPDLLETAIKHLSDATQNQFARDMFIFSLAAFIHSGRLKKEVRASFDALAVSLGLSIDKVAQAFREDLESHKKILDNLAERVTSLEAKQQQPQTQKEK